MSIHNTPMTGTSWRVGLASYQRVMRSETSSSVMPSTAFAAIVPTVGGGVPLFRDAGRRIPLELVESRTMDGGCVLATYRVRH